MKYLLKIILKKPRNEADFINGRKRKVSVLMKYDNYLFQDLYLSELYLMIEHLICISFEKKSVTFQFWNFVSSLIGNGSSFFTINFAFWYPPHLCLCQCRLLFKNKNAIFLTLCQLILPSMLTILSVYLLDFKMCSF